MKQTQIIREGLNKADLVAAFKAVGVKKGIVLEVHSALHGLGYIIGGAQTVVDALLDAVGFEGTLVMPLQSSDNSEPSAWMNPPADPLMWEKIRSSTPAFDPMNSEIQYMGSVVENFRRRQGVYFTRHPSCAFAAYGKYAKLICAHQNLNYPLNEHSPIGQMIELRAQVLLIGCDYTNCTGMHLAEYQSHVRPVMLCGGAIDRGNGTEWVKYLDVDLNSDEFSEPGKLLEQDGKVQIVQMNDTVLRRFRLSTAVNYTKKYLKDKYNG